MRCQQAGFDPAMLDEQQVRTRSLTSFLKFILISYINNNTIKRKKDYQYRLHIHGMIYIVWRSACVHCYSQHPCEVLKLTTFTLLTCQPQKQNLKRVRHALDFRRQNRRRECRGSAGETLRCRQKQTAEVLAPLLRGWCGGAICRRRCCRCQCWVTGCPLQVRLRMAFSERQISCC